jgi:hypothetical protein
LLDRREYRLVWLVVGWISVELYIVLMVS